MLANGRWFMADGLPQVVDGGLLMAAIPFGSQSGSPTTLSSVGDLPSVVTALD